MNRFYFGLLLAIAAQVCSAQTWVRQSGPTGGTLTDIEFDVANSKVYGVVNNRLHVSTDDGGTWARMTGNLANFYVSDIEIGSGTIYVTDGYDVYTSADGAIFTKKNNDNVLSNAYKLKRYGTNSLVAVTTNRVYYSTNGGTTWLQGAAPATGSWNVNSLTVNNVDQIFLSNTSTNVPLRSTDGGISFGSVTNTNLTGALHSMTARNDKTLIYAVTATGLFSSADAAFWTSVKSGIGDATISPSTSTPSLMEFSGDGLGMYFLDNSNFKMYTKTLAAASWTLASAFPGTNQIVNCVSAKNYAAAATSVALFGTNPGVYKTINGGSVVSESNTGLSGISASQIVHEGSNGSMLLNSGSVGLYQSTNSGSNWTRLTNIPSNVTWLSAASSTNTGLNQTTLGLGGFPTYTLYTSANGGTSWTPQTTTASLEWIQGTDYDHVFGMSTSYTFYYSYNKGATTTWTATAISITGLPATYAVYNTNQMSLYSSSASSATMLLQLYNSVTAAYEQWKIVFSIGTLTAITGTATKITTFPVGIPSGNIDKMVAVKGKFYLFSDNTNPDQYAYSSDGGSSWTTRTSPASEGNMFVARNGYVFLTSESPKKVFMSRDDGVSFIETTIPSTVDPFNINDIYIDLYDNGIILSNNEYIHRTSSVIVTPLAPTNPTVLGKTANSISIKWDANSTNADQYNIERSSDGGANYTLVGSVDDSDICGLTAPYQGYYVDGGLAASTSYTYRVSAVNDAGSSTALTFAAVPTLTGSVANIPDSRSWTASNAGGGGYSVITPIVVGVRAVGGNRYEVSDMGLHLASSSDYKESFYESNGTTLVAPTNSSFSLVNNGTGAWNGTNSITLKWKHCSSNNFETITLALNALASDPTPAAPTGVQALITNTSQITISWTSGFYEKDYIVERSPTGLAGSFVQVGSNVNYPTTKITDVSGLVDGTTYYYRVTSRNANNVSSAPSSISVVYHKPYFTLPATTIYNASMVTLGTYWADYDNDGIDDVLFMKDPFSNYGVPAIYESDGLGNFTYHQAAVTTEKYQVASVADFNNDGYPDLAMSIKEKAQLDLYYGNGDFTFTKLNTGQLGDIATTVTDAVLSTSWADINNDGRLDLIVLPAETGTLYLFKQSNTGSFVKIAGGDLGTDICGCSTPLFADYNADGFTDLLVISSNSAWRLYQNNQNETFTNKTSFAGIDASQGVTGAWGDFNSDGLLDLYAAISAGAGVQPIYRNNGNGTFTKDVTSSVAEAATNYGSFWGDFNNDGLQDLIVTGIFTYPTRLYINTTSGSTPTFTRLVNEQINDVGISHYGGAAGDYDNDGYLDAILSSFTLPAGEPLATKGNAFKNNRNLGTTGNWLKVKVVGVNQNKSGIGAQVLLTAGGKTQVREVFSLSSFAAQNSPVQHFGLGNNATITSVQVRWPSGATQTLANPAINQLLVITEDVTAPGITVLSPVHNATSVNANATIEITLNEASTAIGGKNLVVTAVSGGATFATLPVTGAVKAGNKYTFTMPTAFAQNKQYEVTINPGAFQDGYQNAFAGIAAGAWRFTTSAGPQVVTLTPLHTAVGVAASTTIAIDFSIATTAVGGKKLFVYKTSDLVTPVATLDASSAVLSTNKQTFTLPAPLLQATNYTVVVEAGAFKDASQNIFAGIAAGSWTFTSSAGPQVVTLTPANAATGVSGSTGLSLDLNIPTTGVSGKKVYVYKSSDLVNPIYTLDATSAVLAANKQTFTLPAPLQQQTSYTIAVESGAFKDSNDNIFAGIASGSWVFTTASGPQVSLLSPLDNAVNVAAGSSLAITFSAPVTPEPGKKIKLYKDGVATPVFEVDATSGAVSTNTYTFTVTPKMQALTGYTVIVDAFAFKDAGGNFFSGTGTNEWNFTTAQGPSIASTTPLNGATNVSTASAIAITFNRALVSAAPGKKITVISGVTPIASLDVSTNGTVSGSTYTLSAPSSRWPSETLMTVALDAGAFLDAGGNDSDGLAAGVYSFSTVPGPKLTALVPADGASTVAANTTLQITFSVTVTAEAGKKVRVYKDGDPTAVFEGNVTDGTIVGNKATFVITPKLRRETDYTVVVDAFSFKDATGNPFNGIGSTEWNFRTDVGPAILGYSPASGASDVPVNTSIEINFSRALSSAVAGKKMQVFDGITQVADITVATTGTISGTKYNVQAPSGGWPAGKVLSVSLDAGAFVDGGGNESDGLPSGLYSFNTASGATLSIVSLTPAAGAAAVGPNASLEITFDNTITAVATKSIRVADGATQVASSNVLTTGSITGARYTYPAPSGGWPLGKLLTVTLDGGAFVDGTSKPSPAITGTQWTFTTVAAGSDLVSPTIDFTQIPSVDKASLPTSITAHVTDNVAVQSAKLFIRGITGSQFSEVQGSGPTANNTFTFSILATVFDAIGAQYYFTAADAAGNLARFPTTGYKETYVRYNASLSAVPSGLVGTGGNAGSWKVISIPFELGSNNAVSSVFDELFSANPALVYKKDWRLLTLRPEPLAWVDYNNGFSTIERGTGYMINVKDASRANFSVGNDLTAPGNTRDNLFKYTLRKGWNMIGNPYLTPINWANVTTLNNLTGAAAVLKKFSNGQYNNSGLLQPFEGAFVKVDAQIEITIPFEGQVAAGGREKEIVFEHGDWLLPIALRQSDRENMFGGVGMHHESTKSFDPLDDFNGPQFIDFIEMNFDHPNDFPNMFSRDVVGNLDEYVWDFTVTASGRDVVSMIWDSNVKLPAGADLFLYDADAHVAINMREESGYNFDPKVSRKFRIFFGKDAHDRIKPEHSLLGQPYPNPTSGISYIPFALPDGKAEYGVKIEVFDLMGRKVATLVNGQFAPGLHSTQWNGQDSPHSTGLYSIRMTVVTSEEQEVYNAKIVLNK